MVPNEIVTIGKLRLLAQEYLARPSPKKRCLLERYMNQYVRDNPAVDRKQLMQLRLHLFQQSRELEESLRF